MAARPGSARPHCSLAHSYARSGPSPPSLMQRDNVTGSQNALCGVSFHPHGTTAGFPAHPHPPGERYTARTDARVRIYSPPEASCKRCGRSGVRGRVVCSVTATQPSRGVLVVVLAKLGKGLFQVD